MNGTSELIVRDMADKSEESIGKELAQAHRLYCELRDTGFTWEDVESLIAGDDCDLTSHMLWVLRGQTSLDSIPPELVNLDQHPGIRRDRKKKIEIICDLRLGVWMSEWSSGYIKIGGKYLHVARASGLGCQGSEEDYFTRSTLIPGEHIYTDLNLQAAEWLYMKHRDAARNLFEDVGRIANSDEWKDDKIFFLGTVWIQPKQDNPKGKSVPHAKALVSNTEGVIDLRDEPIPAGTWPENCYIVGLVDDPEPDLTK